MGKAYRQAKNKAKRAGFMRPDEPPHRGPCFVEGCEERGGQMFHCVTCEELAAKGKILEADVFRVQYCVNHAAEAEARIKRHALIAHPYNILRVAVAALKGES